MTKSEKIQLAEEIIKALSHQPFNYRLIVRVQENVVKQNVTVQPQTISEESCELMKFSAFTLRDAKKRLNQFDYYIDNIDGTEFEVVNWANGNAYIVDFRPSAKQASCTCPDFINRARICKHIAFVHDSLVSVAQN